MTGEISLRTVVHDTKKERLQKAVLLETGRHSCPGEGTCVRALRVGGNWIGFCPITWRGRNSFDTYSSRAQFSEHHVRPSLSSRYRISNDLVNSRADGFPGKLSHFQNRLPYCPVRSFEQAGRSVDKRGPTFRRWSVANIFHRASNDTTDDGVQSIAMDSPISCSGRRSGRLADNNGLRDSCEAQNEHQSA